MKLRTGATLQSGKYLLSQPLGSDSIGATYLATQTLLKQSVVLKTLDPTLQVTQSFPQIRARFIEQSRLLARSQHPSLVRVVDFFEEDQLPFLVMEFIPGQTLRSRVSTPGAPPLSEAEAVHYMRQTASALSIAHRNGLIHRNIKPQSIVRRQGTNLGVLVGFGLAHDLAIPQALEPNPFLPPQNWHSKNPYGIDLYSLAATLYYLLCNQPPQPLAVEHYPWSAATKEAIVRGLTSDSALQLQTVDDWLRLLPNTILPLIDKPAEPALNAPIQNGHTPTAKPSVSQPPTLPTIAVSPNGSGSVTTPVKQPIAASPSRIVTTATATIAPVHQSVLLNPPKSRSRFLIATMAIFTLLGLAFGVALRISAAKTPGTGILHPSQTFDEREWKGALSAKNNGSDVPIETNSARSRVSPAASETPISKPIESNRFAEPAIVPSSEPPPLPQPEFRPIQPRSTLPQQPIKPVEPASPAKSSDSVKPNADREIAPTTIDRSNPR